MEWIAFFADDSSLAAAGGIYAAVVTPFIGYLMAEIKSLKSKVKKCHEDREDAVIWRTIYEQRLKFIEEKTGINFDEHALNDQTISENVKPQFEKGN